MKDAPFNGYWEPALRVVSILLVAWMTVAIVGCDAFVAKDSSAEFDMQNTRVLAYQVIQGTRLLAEAGTEELWPNRGRDAIVSGSEFYRLWEDRMSSVGIRAEVTPAWRSRMALVDSWGREFYITLRFAESGRLKQIVVASLGANGVNDGGSGDDIVVRE